MPQTDKSRDNPLWDWIEPQTARIQIGIRENGRFLGSCGYYGHRVAASGAKGRAFESPIAHQEYQAARSNI